MEVVVTKPYYRVAEGVIGGILGGIAMGIFEMLGTLAMGNGLMQAFALKGYAFQPFTNIVEMSTANISKGIAIHAVMSMLVGAIFVMIANRVTVQRNTIWLWGALYASLIWVIDRLGALQALDPTMEAFMNQFIFFVAHLVFGASLGAYISRRSYNKPFDRTSNYKI